MKVTDALSRAYSSDDKPKISTEDIAYYVHSVMSHLPISEARLKQFQQETAKDSTFQLLINYTINGWPSVPDISPDVKRFHSQRHETVCNHDMLLKGQRIIFPASLHSEVKHLIHQGHLAVDKCKLPARQSVYWPGISHEVTQFLLNCPTCITHRNRQQQETLLEHDVPAALVDQSGCRPFMERTIFL